MNPRFNVSRGAHERQRPSAPGEGDAVLALGQPSEPLPPATGPCSPAKPEPTQEPAADAEPKAGEAAQEPAPAHDERRDDDPWRAPIPVEDARVHQALAQEVMAAWSWVQRRRARGFKPC